jgi:hypothetical protein
MNRLFLLFAMPIAMLSSVQSKAQKVIAVQNTNRTLLYDKLDSAITYAQNGDTIYLPGGSFNLTIPINKRLHIVGVGHNPDSTTATGRTIINGRIILESGADNGSVTGSYLTAGSVYGGLIDFNSDINGYSITRCYVATGISNGSGKNVRNIIIRENVIGGHDICSFCSNWYSILLSSPNHLITNNILLAKVDVNNSTLQNNVFLFYAPLAFYPYPLSGSDCIVENNIFAASGNPIQNSIFRNNVNGGINGVGGIGNQGSGNYLTGESLNSVFVNYNSSTGWDYNSDFHLAPGSPYAGKGTDGKDIGIYGGAFPWKDGSIPFNPHIAAKKIDAINDANGNIRVQIKVAAQPN